MHAQSPSLNGVMGIGLAMHICVELSGLALYLQPAHAQSPLIDWGDWDRAAITVLFRAERACMASKAFACSILLF